MDTTTPTLIAGTEGTDVVADERVAPAELVEQELLVEEISIDGMCGVY